MTPCKHRRVKYDKARACVRCPDCHKEWPDVPALVQTWEYRHAEGTSTMPDPVRMRL